MGVVAWFCLPDHRQRGEGRDDSPCDIGVETGLRRLYGDQVKFPLHGLILFSRIVTRAAPR